MISASLFSLYCLLLYLALALCSFTHRPSIDQLSTLKLKSSTSTRSLISPSLPQQSTSLHCIMVQTLCCIPLSECTEFQNFEMKQSPLISLLVHHWPWIAVNSQFHHFVQTGEFFFQSPKTKDDDVIADCSSIEISMHSHPTVKNKGETTIALLHHSNYFVILQYIHPESFLWTPFVSVRAVRF